MEKLFISGIIASKADKNIDQGEKVFTFEDLENFLQGREGGDLEVYIDSPGGSVDEGFKIYNRLKAEGVKTIATRANSIASIIFLAGSERLISPDAEMIIHNAWIDPDALQGEKLNYHTSKMLVDYFAETDSRILDVYTSHAGEDKEREIFAYMAVDKNLGASKAIELGFATGLTEEVAAPQALKNRVLTYSQNMFSIIDEQQKQIEMKTEEEIGGIKKLLNSFARAWKLGAKNMTVTTSEGVELYVSGEGEGLAGKTAFIAEEGLPTETPAPTGAHTLSDGTTITVGEGGAIVEAVAPADIEALKATYEEEKKAMEEEKEELQAKVVNLTTENEKLTKNFAKIEKDFLDLKNQVLGDPDEKKTAKKPTAEELKKMTPLEKIRAQAMNKASN